VFSIGYEVECGDCGFKEYVGDRKRAENLVDEHIAEKYCEDVRVESKSRLMRYALLVLGAGFVVGLPMYFGNTDAFRIFVDPELLSDYLASYGRLAAVVLFGLLILNNILWFIPGHGLGVSCGLIYGPVAGTLLCFSGTVVSTVLAIFISKGFGQPVVKRLIGEEKFEKYQYLAESKDVWPFLIFILIPVVPDDAVVYFAGLTDIDWKRLTFICSIGRLAGVIFLSGFGHGLATHNTVLLVVIGVVIAVFSVFSVWKKDKLVNLLRVKYG